MAATTRAVRVVVRCRPPVPREDGVSCACLRVDGASSSVTLVPRGANEGDYVKSFQFDSVLPADASQDETYAAVDVEGAIAAVLAGVHATIFAYGQTGSGKTFSMEGYEYKADVGSSGGPRVHVAPGDAPPARLGIIPRAIDRLFEAAASRTASDGTVYRVSCSYVQIYREVVYDLLNPGRGGAGVVGGGSGVPAANGSGSFRASSGRSVSGAFGVGPSPPSPGLRMRWSRSDEFYLEDVTTVDCPTAAAVMAQFKAGVRNKFMAGHALNAASSRSHALFTVTVVGQASGTAAEAASWKARLCLVDLAGSERSALTGATAGTLMAEAISINTSLFTLRKVITALAAPRSRGPSPHIPYRDSKLTALLKPSLGGCAVAAMLACLAPTDDALEENGSTLEYASRASAITNELRVNEDPKSALIRELRAALSAAQADLAALRAGVGAYGDGGDRSVTTSGAGSESIGGRAAAMLDRLLAPGGAAPAGSPGHQHHRGPSASPVRPVLSRTGDGGRHSTAVRESTPTSGGELAIIPSSGPPPPPTPPTPGDSVPSAQLRAVGAQLVDAVHFVRELVSANAVLRSRAQLLSVKLTSAEESLTAAEEDNGELRSQLALYVAVLAADPTAAGGVPLERDGDASPANGPSPPSLYTAGSAALVEVLSLRAEAAVLRDRLARYEGGVVGQGKSPGAGGGGGGRLVPPPPQRSMSPLRPGGRGAALARAQAETLANHPAASAARGGMLSVGELRQLMAGGTRGGGGAPPYPPHAVRLPSARGGGDPALAAAIALSGVGTGSGVPPVRLSTTGRLLGPASLPGAASPVHRITPLPSRPASQPQPAGGDAATQLAALMRSRQDLVKSSLGILN